MGNGRSSPAVYVVTLPQNILLKGVINMANNVNANDLRGFLKSRHDGFSPLTENREKMSTDEAVNSETLSISLLHLIAGEDGEAFAVVVFDEYPDKFYFSGSILTSIVVDIYNFLGENVGDVVTLAPPVAVRANYTVSKNKRRYVNWTVV